MDALQAEYSSDTGDKYLQAYYDIKSISIQYDTKSANVEVNIYTSQANFNGGFQPVTTNNYQANGTQFDQFFSNKALTGQTPPQAAIQFLQTLPSISNPLIIPITNVIPQKVTTII